MIDRDPDGRLKKPLYCGRGVENDYRASRSRRTASTADGGSAIRERWRKRSRSSATVGRSARWRISAKRKSERDIPATPAWAFRVRCTLSGTLRT